MAWLVGIGTGVSMRTVIEAQIITQTSATFIPLITESGLDTFNNICITIMVITSLFFFTFTRAKGKTAENIRKIGRYTLMLTFGAAFGGTVMTRMTLFIGRWTFLWSPEARYYLIPVGVIMFITLALSDKIAKAFKV